jgi:enoyl-CoA hydratase/carnithine racemase
VPALDRQDQVFVLDLGDGENRFHPDWIASVDAALDEVEKTAGPRALVTAATGKFFSNGLDLDWLFAHTDQHQDYVVSVHRLLARVLSLPVVTVAALQGHTFAAGAMLSLAHDFRVMRADRGFWCLPEADIGIPFTPGMSALIQARLAPQTAHRAMVTAGRFGGQDAAAAGIVDHAVGEDAVRATAVELARAEAAKAGDTLGTIKARMYAPALAALRDRDNPLGRHPGQPARPTPGAPGGGRRRADRPVLRDIGHHRRGMTPPCPVPDPVHPYPRRRSRVLGHGTGASAPWCDRQAPTRRPGPSTARSRSPVPPDVSAGGSPGGWPQPASRRPWWYGTPAAHPGCPAPPRCAAASATGTPW